MKDINAIWSLIDKDRIILNKTIIDCSKSYIQLNNDVTKYIFESGGKQIRPLILLLLARSLNYKGNLQYKLATAVEFIHTATLLHDDVVDGSDRRRNRETVNSKFTNATSVLVGDFLYTRAFQIITKELNAAKIMADASNELATGEVVQLMQINNFEQTEEDYYQIIYLKTAVLFSAACEFSAILAKKEEISPNLKKYGELLGMGFQIADDVLDYIGDKQEVGKNIGDDLAESKMTLPFIHSLNSKQNKYKEQLRKIIKNGERESINQVIDILNSTDSIEYSLKIAKDKIEKAKKSIHFLDDSKYKDALLTIADFVVKRLG